MQGHPTDIDQRRSIPFGGDLCNRANEKATSRYDRGLSEDRILDTKELGVYLSWTITAEMFRSMPLAKRSRLFESGST